jgi:hypothetical protein
MTSCALTKSKEGNNGYPRISKYPNSKNTIGTSISSNSECGEKEQNDAIECNDKRDGDVLHEVLTSL